MKNHLVLIVMLALAGTALSQTENDDLYFSAKDRQRENDARPKINRAITLGQESIQDIFGDDRPSLSTRNRIASQHFDGAYSGRTMNPDFDPYAQEGSAEEYQYFNSTYAPLGVNGRLYDRYNDPSFPSSTFNNTWNNPYRNSFYGAGFGGWGYNRFNDPFYSPFGYGYNSFGSFYDPYYGSGCFSCFSPGWGSGFGNSWFSMSYGFNSFGWNSPFMGYGFSSWNRPGMVIINQYDRYPRVVYGKRPSRSINSNNDARQNVRSAQPMVSGSGSRSNQAGRSAADRTTNYYNRGWRQEATINSNSGSSSTTKSSGWSNRNSSGWLNDNSSRGSSSFGSGGSNRSSGFSGGGFSGGSGSSSSGARRGRN